MGALNNSWHYVADFDQGFDRKGVGMGIVEIAQWNLLGSVPNGVHDATGLGLFDSGTLSPPNYFDYAFVAAGTYEIKDLLSHSMVVKVSPKVIPKSGDLSTSFFINSGGPPTGDVGDAQIAYCVTTPCTPAFRTWRHGDITGGSQFSASDPAWQGAGTYYFRARVRNPSTGASSGWSPTKDMTVT